MRIAITKRNHMSHIISGILLILAGLYLIVFSRLKSEGRIYRLLVARSRILWGDNVHAFHQVAGAIVIVFGIAVTAGLFQRLY